MWTPSAADGPSLDELRRQLALVRTLIDELDRLATWDNHTATAFGEQLQEDLARLGHRIVAYAASMGDGPSIAKVPSSGVVPVAANDLGRPLSG
jgi:hypothetical protein